MIKGSQTLSQVSGSSTWFRFYKHAKYKRYRAIEACTKVLESHRGQCAVVLESLQGGCARSFHEGEDAQGAVETSGCWRC